MIRFFGIALPFFRVSEGPVFMVRDRILEIVLNSSSQMLQEPSHRPRGICGDELETVVSTRLVSDWTPFVSLFGRRKWKYLAQRHGNQRPKRKEDSASPRGLHHSKECTRCPRDNYTNKTRLIKRLREFNALRAADVLSVTKRSRTRWLYSENESLSPSPASAGYKPRNMSGVKRSRVRVYSEARDILFTGTLSGSYCDLSSGDFRQTKCTCDRLSSIERSNPREFPLHFA